MSDDTRRTSARLKWVEVDPDDLGEPYVPACQCDQKKVFDVTISEGNVLLKHVECGEFIDLDDYGWWYEAIELQEPVRVEAEWVIENDYIDGPQPAYILLTPSAPDQPTGATDE